MTDVQKRIERARELDKAATPGPWKHDNVQLQNAVIAGPGRGVIVPWGCLFEDARLIAESRALLPALADDCEALKIELTAARSDLAAMVLERDGLREELARVRAELDAAQLLANKRKNMLDEINQLLGNPPRPAANEIKDLRAQFAEHKAHAALAYKGEQETRDEMEGLKDKLMGAYRERDEARVEALRRKSHAEALSDGIAAMTNELIKILGQEFSDPEQLYSLVRKLREERDLLVSGKSVVHECPPKDEGLMPCCGRTPFEVPRTDRMATDPALVNCDRARHRDEHAAWKKEAHRYADERDALGQERDALRAQLARYEQAGLPEGLAEIERRHAIAEATHGARNAERMGHHRDRATLLAAVRKLQAERDALRPEPQWRPWEHCEDCDIVGGVPQPCAAHLPSAHLDGKEGRS